MLLKIVVTLPAWASAGGGNGHLLPLVIGTKNQKFLEKPEVSKSIPINCFNACNDSLFVGITLILHKIQVHCSDVVMSSHFTHVRYFDCRDRFRNVRAYCSTVGLYCVTITWQQVKKVHFKFGSKCFGACGC